MANELSQIVQATANVYKMSNEELIKWIVAASATAMRYEKDSEEYEMFETFLAVVTAEAVSRMGVTPGRPEYPKLYLYGRLIPEGEFYFVTMVEFTSQERSQQYLADILNRYTNNEAVHKPSRFNSFQVVYLDNLVTGIIERNPRENAKDFYVMLQERNTK